MALSGSSEVGRVDAATKEVCCGYCMRDAACGGAAYHTAGKLKGHCVLRKAPLHKKADAGGIVCVPKRTTGSGMDWVVDASGH
jgi:hypothetical protein